MRTPEENGPAARQHSGTESDASASYSTVIPEVRLGLPGHVITPNALGDEATNLHTARAVVPVQPDLNLGVVTSPARIGPVLVNMADVQAEPVRWLWPGRIPAGMLSIIAGDPGLGKSTFTTAIAAIVSTGGTWPGGGTCEAGGVLWLSAEDDPSRVLAPRLDAHGADRSRIVVLDGVRRSPGGAVAHPSLADDLPALTQAIEQVPNCRLIIIDPVSAYLGRTDANANAEVRAMLTPLKAIAEKTGAAVLLVQHLNKSDSNNALHRSTGSIGFVGAARTVFILARDPDDDQRRLFLCAKSNIGPEPTGLAFRIAGEPARIEFEADPVTMTANEALAANLPAVGGDRTALAEARDWLQERLTGNDGVPAQTVIDDAKGAGIAKRTLDRAKRVLKVQAVRAPSEWLWRLPASTEDRQVRQGGETGDVGNVGDRPQIFLSHDVNLSP